MQIEEAESTETLQKLMNSPEFAFRFECGYPKPTTCITIDDRDSIARYLAMHHVVYSQKAELDQIKLGLEVLHVIELVNKYPTLMKPFFVSTGRAELTTEMMLSLFTVNWSVKGSNKREREEDTILHWHYYLSELEGMQCVLFFKFI